MARLKLLCELEMKELRRELRERGLKAVGNRETLQTRLREELTEEGEDADTYLFVIEPDVVKLFNTLIEQKLADLRNVLKNETCATVTDWTSVISKQKLKQICNATEQQPYTVCFDREDCPMHHEWK